MPPGKKPPDAAIETLRRWIEAVASFDGFEKEVPAGKDDEAAKSIERPITPEERGFWAFQRPHCAAPPRVSYPGWGVNPPNPISFAKRTVWRSRHRRVPAGEDEGEWDQALAPSRSPHGRARPYRERFQRMAGLRWVKGGTVVGATDEYGYRAVENSKSIYALPATILRLLGLDYERLTYRFNARDMRLTDVHGRVIGEVVA